MENFGINLIIPVLIYFSLTQLKKSEKNNFEDSEVGSIYEISVIEAFLSPKKGLFSIEGTAEI